MWSPELAQIYATEYKYYNVENNMDERLTQVNVNRNWSERSNAAIRERRVIDIFIYVPYLRLAGTYNNILAFLEASGSFENAREFLDNVLKSEGYYYSEMGRRLQPPYITNYTPEALDNTFVIEFQNTKQHIDRQRNYNKIKFRR